MVLTATRDADGLVPWTPTLATIEPFVRSVVERFGLAGRDVVAVRALVGSTNRLWRLDVGDRSYVVKELTHDARGPAGAAPARRSVRATGLRLGSGGDARAADRPGW
jgi:hypothetical protein